MDISRYVAELKFLPLTPTLKAILYTQSKGSIGSRVLHLPILLKLMLIILSIISAMAFPRSEVI